MKANVRKTYSRPSIEVIDVKSFFLVCVCTPVGPSEDCTGISA